jgi:transposase
VVDWLQEQTPQFRDGILFVAIDPAAVYAKAVRTVLADGTRLLPNARLVVDHFHLVKLANDCVTAVRRRVIWEQKGRRGRKIDPAWRTVAGCSQVGIACQQRDPRRCGMR